MLTLSISEAVIGMNNFDVIERLRQKYLIGTDARWPTKRVYTSPEGRSWELNDIRLQVWAHNLVCIYLRFTDFMMFITC